MSPHACTVLPDSGYTILCMALVLTYSLVGRRRGLRNTSVNYSLSVPLSQLGHYSEDTMGSWQNLRGILRPVITPEHLWETMSGKYSFQGCYHG